MINNLRKIIFFTSLFLLVINLIGVLFSPFDYRANLNKKTKPYKEAILEFDRLYSKYGPTKIFLEKAVKNYEESIEYSWDKKFTRAPLFDNWILYFLSFTGFANDSFRYYETNRYKMALRRGFGICSQNAIGLCGLLKERYKISCFPVGLHGHVVSRVVLPTGSEYILDPSVGFFFNFGFPITDKKYEKIHEEYQRKNCLSIAEPFLNKNIQLTIDYKTFTHARMATNYIDLTYFLKWIIPLLGLGFYLFTRKRSNNK